MKALRDNPVSTGLTIPQNLTLSLYQQLSPGVALLADVGGQNWGAFDKTIITVDGERDIQAEIPRDFKDTWTASAGFHWRSSPKWLFMAGGGYTSSAVDDENRTPDMPADAQFRMALGAENDLSDNWHLGLNYTYLNLGNNEVNTTAGPSHRPGGRGLQSGGAPHRCVRVVAAVILEQ